jgi:hypothetical protein
MSTLVEIRAHRAYGGKNQAFRGYAQKKGRSECERPRSGRKRPNMGRHGRRIAHHGQTIDAPVCTIQLAAELANVADAHAVCSYRNKTGIALAAPLGDFIYRSMQRGFSSRCKCEHPVALRAIVKFSKT